MASLRFNHVFAGLMVLSGASAFAISPHVSDGARAYLAAIFAPVARPANAIGGWYSEKVSPSPPRDLGSPNAPRGSRELIEENAQLRILVSYLTRKLDVYKDREATLAQLGELRAYCTTFKVAGVDSGTRLSLLISGPGFASLKPDTPVLYASGLVGLIKSSALGTARVQLITDPDTRLSAVFQRVTTPSNPEVAPSVRTLDLPQTLFVGNGRDGMTARAIQSDVEKAGLKLNDSVVLSDQTLDARIDGHRLGFVSGIAPSRDPGFAIISLRPDQSLTNLQEVLVMNKEVPETKSQDAGSVPQAEKRRR